MFMHHLSSRPRIASMRDIDVNVHFRMPLYIVGVFHESSDSFA
jgi:hypothetical protein